MTDHAASPARPRIGAFLVTYRRPRALERSIRSILDQTRPPDLLLIVDNAASPESERLLRSFARPDIVYHPTERNLGSAGGTALGTTLLAREGVDLIYSGDDDNPPRTADTLERIFDLLAQAPADVGGAGTVGARWDWHRGALSRLRDEDLEGAVEVDFIGGDHKLTLRRGVVERVGPPAADLFFGYPDLEHCLRIRRAGYRLLVDGQLMRRYRDLAGRLGTGRHRSLLPRRPYDDLWRTYYTTRNYVFMMRATFGRPDLARRQLFKILGRCLASGARGPRYCARFTLLQLHAVRDGYRGHLGATVPVRAKGSAR